jgi:hypothetical protein
MQHTITRTVTRTVLATTMLAVVAAGCGNIVERATEEAVERVVEEAVEADTGGDVDIEFNDDGISVESDEGDFSLSIDEDGVEIDGTDADGNDFSLDADEDGINAESEDGTFDVDSDGTFTATDADGDVTTGEVSGDGDSVDFTVEGEDGDAEFTSGEGIPSQWPSDVPEPEGLDDVFGTYISDAENVIVTVNGTTPADAKDVFEDYADRLTDAGFSEETNFNQGDEFYSATFLKGDTTVGVTTQAGADSTDVIVIVN